MKNPIKAEPALLGAAVVAILQMVFILEWWVVTVVQQGAVTTAALAVMALFVRQSVTPIDKGE